MACQAFERGAQDSRASAVGVLVQCCTCKDMQPQDHCIHLSKKDAKEKSWRCKKDHRFLGRLSTLRRTEPALGEAYNNISPDRKLKFQNESHALMGEALKAALIDAAVMEQVENAVNKMEAKSDWKAKKRCGKGLQP